MSSQLLVTSFLQLLDSYDVTTRDFYSGPFNIEEQIIQKKPFSLLPTFWATNSPFSWHPPLILRAFYDLELAVAAAKPELDEEVWYGTRVSLGTLVCSHFYLLFTALLIRLCQLTVVAFFLSLTNKRLLPIPLKH